MQHCPNLIHALDIGQHLWEVFKSAFITSPGKRCRPSSVKTLWSVLYLIHFLYSWPETLHCTLIQTNFLTLRPPNPIFKSSLHRQLRWSGNAPLHSQSTNFLTLPPSPVFENSPYRQLIIINDAYSRWSNGNRGRATSIREVIEVAGSNHAIGVILNLAWGPNNFSPSMIWSWRTRSNSRSGLGAE